MYERKRVDIDPEVELDTLVSKAASDPGLAIDVRRAFGMLPDAYREPLLLQVLGGLSSAEIAATMNSTEEAVNMRLSRARKTLRTLLDGETPAPERSTARKS